MRTHAHFLLTLAAVLAFAAAAPAVEDTKPAKKEPGSRGAMLDRVDTDSDGKLSFDELHAAMPRLSEKRFARMDKNGDGVLSRNELRALPRGSDDEGRSPDRLLKRADENKDGKVSYAELTAVFPEFSERRFKSADTDGNGFITPGELPERDTKNQASEESGRNTPMAIFRRADRDKNGEVSYEDVAATGASVSREAFDRIDANGDGVVSRREVSAPETPRDNAMMTARRNVGEQLAELDANGDGQTTFDEVETAKPGFPRKAFDRYDRNNDGVITADDYAT